MQKINSITQSVLELSHRENADNDNNNDDDDDNDDTHPGWIIVCVGMYSVADKNTTCTWPPWRMLFFQLQIRFLKKILQKLGNDLLGSSAMVLSFSFVRTLSVKLSIKQREKNPYLCVGRWRILSILNFLKSTFSIVLPRSSTMSDYDQNEYCKK